MERAVEMWSLDRLGLLSLMLAATLAVAVVRDWRVIEMVAGLALLPAVALTAFRAIIDSLRRL